MATSVKFSVHRAFREITVIFACFASFAGLSQVSPPDLRFSRDVYNPAVYLSPKYPVASSTGSGARETKLNMRVRYPGVCVHSPDRIVTELGTRITVSGTLISIANAFRVDALDFTSTCSSTFGLDLGVLTPNKYRIQAIPLNGPYTEAQQQESPTRRTQEVTFAVLTEAQALRASIEIPAQDSVQSGIGLISGWACLAENIEISIDGGARVKVPAEAPRGDVESVCSHPNAGFGLLMNYNTLSEGEHSIQLFIKDFAMGEPRKFKVVKPKGEFARGLVRQISVSDFPEVGKTTVLDWREGEQRFGIKEVK